MDIIFIGDGRFGKNNCRQAAAVEKVLAAMPEKGRAPVKALLNGQTQVEVSRSTGMSQALVSYYLKFFWTRLEGELDALQV